MTWIKLTCQKPLTTCHVYLSMTVWKTWVPAAQLLFSFLFQGKHPLRKKPQAINTFIITTACQWQHNFRNLPWLSSWFRISAYNYTEKGSQKGFLLIQLNFALSKPKIIFLGKYIYSQLYSRSHFTNLYLQSDLQKLHIKLQLTAEVSSYIKCITRAGPESHCPLNIRRSTCYVANLCRFTGHILYSELRLQTEHSDLAACMFLVFSCATYKVSQL